VPGVKNSNISNGIGAPSSVLDGGAPWLRPPAIEDAANRADAADASDSAAAVAVVALVAAAGSYCCCNVKRRTWRVEARDAW